jgi:predicted small secreted protein
MLSSPLFKKPLFALLLATFALGSLGSLNACSTTEGFGQDVQDTGEYIEDTAEDAS